MLRLGDRIRKIACARCQRRKKKCDHERPSCGECLRTRSECVPCDKIKKRHVSASYVQSLEDHIESLEQYVVQLEDRSRFSHPETVEDHFPMPVSLDSKVTGKVSDHDLAVATASPLLSLSELLDNPESDLHHVAEDGSNSRDTAYETSVDFLGSDEIDNRTTVFYVYLYFSHVQTQFPFIQEYRWKWWAKEYEERDFALDQWRGFFVNIIWSIGALVAQKFDSNSKHNDRAEYYHSRAMSYYDLALQQPSYVIRIQASLLLTIRSMHGDLADEICAHAAAAMMQCTLSNLAEQKQRNSTQQEPAINIDSILENMVKRQTMRICYTIDRLIAIAMDRPVSVADELIDAELLACYTGDTIALQEPSTTTDRYGLDSSSGTTDADHKFRLRRIQSRVCTEIEKVEQESRQRGGEVLNLWYSDLRFELDQWKAEIPDVVTSPHNNCSSNKKWMDILYSYTVISLFPNPRLAANGSGAQHLVTAASQALLIYRTIQTDELECFYTLTALIHQFQAGVIILFCMWAIPLQLQHEIFTPGTLNDALDACSATLRGFASRWVSAKNFHRTFDILLQGFTRNTSRGSGCKWTYSADEVKQVQYILTHLKKLHTQRRILDLINDMCGKGSLAANSHTRTSASQESHPTRRYLPH